MIPRRSAGGIVLNPEGKIALVEQHGNTWSYPKGGIEEGESELDAAKREIEEEAGISDLTLVRELGTYERYSIAKDGVSELTSHGLRERIIFLFSTMQTVPAKGSDPTHEITQVRFVTIDEAKELLTHPKDREFLESVRDKIKV
jgi:8-oxo-dGTP pyrophosphatase MutT (NUDIX family)